MSLQELGGQIFRTIRLGGGLQLPLVVVPFTPESVEPVRAFDRAWHTWSEDDRLPVIKTERFIAVPPELGARALELDAQRARGRQTKSGSLCHSSSA
jgi:hypothetical protein